MDTHAINFNAINPGLENSSDESILSTKRESIINFKPRPNSGIKVSPTREGGRSKSDWQILSIKISCAICIIVSLIVALAPFAGLINFFLDPKVNASDTVNAQTETLDNKCAIINNSSLGFDGNRSNISDLVCEFPYTSNGSLCVPVCGTSHPGGLEYGVAARVITCLSASFSLIGCLLGIFTWIKIGKKMFVFPQVIPFYLLICAAIQALCILAGQIHYEKFYCSSENLIGSREQPTIQCYIQGAIFHYASLVFVIWYLIYVAMILLVLSFPFKLRFMNTGSWKPHLALFIVAAAVPLIILVIFWAVDDTRYEIVNHPVVCLPTPYALVITIMLPLAIMEFLSLSSITLIMTQLIIKKYRLRHHKVTNHPLSDEQNQFIIRTLGVTVIFTAINLFLTIEFGTRASSSNFYDAYVDLFWACVTRYGNNETCCVNNYVGFYRPQLGVMNDFLFCAWGFVAISTLGVKEARNFWFGIFSKFVCFVRKSTEKKSKREFSSSFQAGNLKRRFTGVFHLKSFEEKQNSDSGIETESKNIEIGTKEND